MPTKSDAVEIAERLRQAVRERRPVGVPVTVSIGVAVSRPGRVDTDELVSRADAALYAAKAGGRDRVVVGNGDEPRRRRRLTRPGGCAGARRR